MALTQKQAADAFGVAPVPVALGGVMIGGLFLRQLLAWLSAGELEQAPEGPVCSFPLLFFFLSYSR